MVFVGLGGDRAAGGAEGVHVNQVRDVGQRANVAVDAGQQGAIGHQDNDNHVGFDKFVEEDHGALSVGVNEL